MNKTFRYNPFSVTLAAVALCGASMAAEAVDRRLNTQTNGTGVCQAALPNYEGVLRKRPLAIQNEGTSSSFVNCSPVSFQHLPVSPASGYQVVLVNRSGADVSINCTGVVGGDIWSGTPTLIAKSRTVGNNAASTMTFSAAEVGTSSYPFNFQCLLPPGTGISTIYTLQMLDIGT